MFESFDPLGDFSGFDHLVYENNKSDPLEKIQQSESEQSDGLSRVRWFGPHSL